MSVSDGHLRDVGGDAYEFVEGGHDRIDGVIDEDARGAAIGGQGGDIGQGL